MKPGVLMTKKNLVVSMLLTIFILLSGCKKDFLEPQTPIAQGKSTNVSHPGTQSSSTTQPQCEQTVVLTAGQNITVGTMHYINNNSGTVDFTYSVEAPWKIIFVSLYVGDCAQIPVNSSGNAVPGLYPYKKSLADGGDITALIQVPRDAISTCGCISAHAVVYNTVTGATETAWAEGTRFTHTNWAMYFPYCLADCYQGCAYPFLYWYYEVNASNLPPSITLGEHVYTPGELYSISQYADIQNATDSKNCLIQIATIKLSETHIPSNSGVWNDVSICQNYLNTFGQKLSPTYLPTGNSNARQAADRIANWIRNNNCN